MELNYKNVYFIGIGGIGMSALARYFVHEGYCVSGYDRKETSITKSLNDIGVATHFEESIDLIEKKFFSKTETLVVYTPAIPASHSELLYFIDNDYDVIKRSRMLGILTEGKFLMAVAGTHGKTSTSTMLAHLNYISTKEKGSAFLGGISKNYSSNLVLGGGNRLTVEADEFDRSFLQLYPDIALITSTDADHLDIYDNHNAFKETFSDFVSQIKQGGTLIYRYGIKLDVKNKNIRCYNYSLSDQSDFRAEKIKSLGDGTYNFDIVCPDRIISGCHLGAVGLINVENCIGAVAMMWAAGEFNEELLKEAINSFCGVKRRLEILINTPNLVYIDDYAHHPQELYSTINSIRGILRNRKITAIFQPHLFTRTRDFVDGFAKSLSLCDSVILLPIYPAREEPIDGVDSFLIKNKMTVNCEVVNKEDIMATLKDMDLDILITFGAGDIDTLCSEIVECFV